MWRLGRAGVVAVLLGLGACNAPERPLLQALPSAPAGVGAATPRLNGTVGSPAAEREAQYSVAPPVVIAPPTGVTASAQGNEAADISLDFVETDIREVAAQVLGGVLRVNYTIDPAVRGRATLRTERPLTRGQAVAALQALLAQNGAALLQSGGLYRVVTQAAATATSGLAEGPAAAGSTVVPLRFASAEDLTKVLQPFVGAGGRITADPGRNAVLVSGDPTSRQTLLNLVSAFDVNLLAGQSYAVFPVTDGDAKDFAQSLQDALRGQGGAALASGVRVVPMQRINAVLVASPQPRYIEDVRRVFAVVERARRSSVRGWSVYYLQNSRSNDIAYVLQQAFTPRNVTAQPSPQGGVGPGRASRSLGSNTATGAFGTGSGIGVGGAGISGGVGLGGQGGGLSGSGAGPGGGLGQGVVLGQGAPGAGAEANPLLGGLDPGGAGGGGPGGPGGGPGGGDAAADGMRIIPNAQNNALLIYASPQERDAVESTLRRLDILPLQVRIDATIAEVSLNDQLRYGTQFFFTSGEFNSVLSTATAASVATGGLNTALPGFVFAGRADNGAPLAISALQAITDVRVLSSPQVMVLDNEPARLQVGSLVPFLTQSAQSTLAAGAPLVSSVDYRETGVIMEVTPRVNSGGLVTLDISQEVSAVDPTQTTPGLNSPTFSQRVVRTRVAVQDGQTVGLAGLISDNLSRGNSGIPVLSQIPLIGPLFGTQSNARQRTELLVLITPRVIHDQRDARALTEDLRDQMLNAAALPGQLRGLPAGGSADPQARVRRRLGGG